MRAIIIAGAYWGDEGKGKFAHYEVRRHNIRYGGKANGGPNAGHTVVEADGTKFAFHLLPSTILYPQVTNFIGCGVVVNPQILLDKEISNLTAQRRWYDNLMIDGDANVIMPYHILEDRIRGGAIGTTAQGIGPAYTDKDRRVTAIRINDLLDRETLRQKLHSILPDRKRDLEIAYGELDERQRSQEPLWREYHNLMSASEEDLLSIYSVFGLKLKGFVRNVPKILTDAMYSGDTVLFEMAQGALLDKDKGTYPYTTSSNTTASYAFTGTGTADKGDKEVICVKKAYPTRVGRGSMPTEIKDEKIRNRIIEVGGEIGTTTGRVRRPGWPDMVAYVYSIMLNGPTQIAVTKVDVLGGLPEIKICTRYKLHGEEIKHFRNNDRILSQVEPVYEVIKGWSALERGQWLEVAQGKRSLPDELEQYLAIIEKTGKVTVTLVSFGPEVDMTLER